MKRESKATFPKIMDGFMILLIIILVQVGVGALHSVQCNGIDSNIVGLATLAIYSGCLIYCKQRAGWFEFRSLPKFGVIVPSLFFVFSFILIGNVLAGSLSLLLPKYFELSYPELYFFPIVVFAPVMEEIIFRGYFLNGLLKKVQEKSAILYSSILFAICHLHPSAIIVSLFMGVALGYIYSKTRSLVLVIWIHMMNNFFAWRAYDPGVENIYSDGSIKILAAGALFLFPVLFFVIKISSIWMQKHELVTKE